MPPTLPHLPSLEEKVAFLPPEGWKPSPSPQGGPDEVEAEAPAFVHW